MTPSRFSIVTTAATSDPASVSSSTTTTTTAGLSKSKQHTSRSRNNSSGGGNSRRNGDDSDAREPSSDDQVKCDQVNNANQQDSGISGMDGDSSRASDDATDRKSDRKVIKPTASISALAFKPRGLIQKPKSKIQL